MPQRRYTVEEYFSIEESSEIKHEHCDGTIFAMAGASINHNRIVRNVLGAFQNSLKDSNCEAFGSDLRLHTPSGLYTYPDVIVICGAIELIEGPPETVCNPALIVEVLSDSTAEYDRGEKFSLYQSIPTLRDYILIEQNKAAVDHYAGGAEGTWTLNSRSGLAGGVITTSTPATLSMTDIYAGVFK